MRSVKTIKTTNYSIQFYVEYYERKSSFAKQDPSVIAKVRVCFRTLSNDRYLPDIYVDDFKELNENFELESPITCRMQTTSYGAIGGNDLKKFLEDVAEAKEVIDTIENFDWKVFKGLLK